MEAEEKGQLPFLDVLLSKQSASDHRVLLSHLFIIRRLTLVYFLIISVLTLLNTN